MAERLLLSRGRLASFLACQRQFQLRVLTQLTWPENPLRPSDEERLARGQQFHQLLERYFLGLPIESAAIPDRQVRRWWLLFENSSLKLPQGSVLPELTLTIPIGNHLLHGRFDLLIIGEKEGTSFAHIVDWKTGKPQDEVDLRHEWQTRLYLAMIAAGGAALGRVVKPDQIKMTYWYTSEPDMPRTIQYSQRWHDQNWAELEAIVAQIDEKLAQDSIWPLTDDLAICRRCVYQIYCGRQEAGAYVTAIDEDAELPLFAEDALEPELP